MCSPRCEPVPAELKRAADVLERRWAISVIYASRAGAQRFVDFRDALNGIPPATLASRLNDLVAHGLMERGGDGRRGRYELTALGAELSAIVADLGSWARRG